MDTNGPPEPTAEQCGAHAPLQWVDRGRTAHGFAIWYPQMGGYVGKAVIEPTVDEKGSPGCFEAWVWHDGEFPFHGDSPVVMHHCSPEQFIRFGEAVIKLACQPITE